MIKFQDRLYDYEKVEWDKILNSIEQEKHIVQTSRKKLHKFYSIEGCKPIEIYRTWKYAKAEVEFDIICLQYYYDERENIGDGQIGHSSRVSSFKFTSFWFTSEGVIKIPKMIIEPATLEEQFLQLLKIKPLFSPTKFNLKYTIKTNELKNNKPVLTKYIQVLFGAYHKIWFESLGNAVLIRDDKPMNLGSFKKKFAFTKEIIKKITEKDFSV